MANTEKKQYSDLNHVVLGGRLTADAEFKTGEKDGRKWKIVKFSMASNTNDDTMFINVSLPVPEAYQGKGLVKGAKVTVAGKISVKHGEKKAFIDIRPNGLDDIQVFATAAAAPAAAPAAEETTDTDIPF